MSQNEWILQELKKRPLTPMDALTGCGCLRLAARVLELKSQGHKICRELIVIKDRRYARYSLLQAK